MGIRVTGSSWLQLTTNLLNPAAAFTVCGWARLNTLGAGFFQTLFALESATSTAASYASFGWLSSGNLAFDVVGSGDFTEITGTGLGVGTWVFWYVQNDIVPATDTWTAGVYTPTLGWQSTTKSVTAAWTSAVVYLGVNSYNEGLDVTIGPVKIWTATLTQAELDLEAARILPVRTANLNRFSPFRIVTELTDYSGNGLNWTTGGTPTASDSPPVSWGRQPVWKVPFAVAAGVTLTPAFASAAATAIAPTVQAGAITLTPATASAAATAIAPIVVIGTGIPLPDDTLIRNASSPLILNGPAAYDVDKAGPRHVVKVASNDYRMLYEAGSTTGGTTAYATSTDGTTWTKYAGNPVMSPNPANWEVEEASITSWFWDDSIQKYIAYYHGGSNVDPRQIGRATADHPAGPWTKYAGNPIITPSVSGWDDANVADCKVIKIGAVYHMWYNGNDGTLNQIGHATSSDGISWTKDGANPVLASNTSGWDSGDAQSPGVLYDAYTGIFHMWYIGDDGSAANEAIGYAYSTDGVNWSRGANNPVFTEPVPPKVTGDTIDAYTDNGIYRVLYGEFDFSGSPTVRSIAEATLDVTGDGVSYMPAVAAAAAGAVAPAVVRGPITLTPAAAGAGASAVAPTVVRGAVVVAPAAAASAAVAIAPTVVLGATSATPATASAAATAVAPAVVLGAITLTPAVASAAAEATAPAVVLGATSVTPAPAAASASAVAPIVTTGGITVVPAVAASVAIAIAPTVVQGATSITPAAAGAGATAVAPVVVLGAITLTPAVASAAATAVAPAVTTGGIVPAPAVAVAGAVGPVVVLGAITLTPDAAGAAATAVAPSVQAGTAVTVTPAPAMAVTAAIAPAVGMGAIVLAPAFASAAATAPNPAIIVGLIVAVVTLHAQRRLVLTSRRNLVLTYRRD